jgi:hypothetical protein
MQNPANFGMAKSFVMLGRARGFDMTTEEGLLAFTEAYTSDLSASAPPSLPVELLSPRAPFDPPDFHAHRATKKSVSRRKMAQNSRRKNRKK